MNEDNRDYREGWYRPGPGTEDGEDRKKPSTPDVGGPDPETNSLPGPADAEPSTHTPPPRSAGSFPNEGGIYGDRKRSRATLKAVLLVACVLILIIASALIFADKSGGQAVEAPASAKPEVTVAPTPGFSIPGFGEWSWGEGGETVPGAEEDYRDYFNDYYTGVAGENSIPAAETDPDVEIVIEDAPELELSLQQIYTKCNPAVVGITTYVGGTEYGWGSGMIFDSDGYILTNYHVLEDAEEAKVSTSDGTQYDARIVGYDSSTDVAVLKIEARRLPSVEIGDSDALQVGDSVVAIGNPLGEEYRGTMTNGIISAISRDMSYSGHSQTLLQTNAALNEGNSGGPLINMYGQVIGITNMKMVSYTGVTIEGIGFAIPSSTFKLIVDELMENGYVVGRPGIGITAGSIEADIAAYYDLPDGLYVSSVTEGGGAWNAGIREGDIITEVEGEPCSTVGEINAVKDTLQVGDILHLTVYRDGETFTADVELMDMNRFSK